MQNTYMAQGYYAVKNSQCPPIRPLTILFGDSWFSYIVANCHCHSILLYYLVMEFCFRVLWTLRWQTRKANKRENEWATWLGILLWVWTFTFGPTWLVLFIMRRWAISVIILIFIHNLASLHIWSDNSKSVFHIGKDVWQICWLISSQVLDGWFLSEMFLFTCEIVEPAADMVASSIC